MLKIKSPLRTLLITALIFQNSSCLADQNHPKPFASREYLALTAFFTANIAVSGVLALISKSLKPSSWLAATATPIAASLATILMNRCFKKFNRSTYPELENRCDNLCRLLTPLGSALTAISFAGKYGNFYALIIPAAIITIIETDIVIWGIQSRQQNPEDDNEGDAVRHTKGILSSINITLIAAAMIAWTNKS